MIVHIWRYRKQHPGDTRNGIWKKKKEKDIIDFREKCQVSIEVFIEEIRAVG